MTGDPLAALPLDFQPSGAATSLCIREVERTMDVSFPDDYRQVLRTVNGGEGPVGEESYLILWPAQDLVEHNRGYKLDAQYASDLTFIGTDGGNEVFAIRSSDGHYVAAPLIGMAEEAIKDLGGTFVEFVKSLR